MHGNYKGNVKYFQNIFEFEYNIFSISIFSKHKCKTSGTGA